MDEMRILNQPVHRSGALMDHLSRRIRMRSEVVLAPLGLRARHLVALTVLRAQEGGISQQALASTLEMDGTNIVGLLNDLEADGLVERKRSPEDRRRHVVELTEAGNVLLARAEFFLAAVEDEVFSALSASQREELFSLLRQAMTGSAEEACSRVAGCGESSADDGVACGEPAGDAGRTSGSAEAAPADGSAHDGERARGTSAAT